MKFSIKDIKNVDQKRSVGRKPKKVVEKRPHMNFLATPSTIVPSLRGVLAPLPEVVPTAIGMEVVEEISSPLLPALASASMMSFI